MSPKPILAAVAVAALAATLVLVRAVSSPDDPAPVPAAAAVAPDRAAEAPAASLYDLELETLTDSAGRAMTLDAHRGHPVVVSMFYAKCPAACPALMLEMKDMDAKLAPAARADVRYLLVSFDPARDDTKALATVKEDHALDDRWTLARTDAREVRVLATALGLRYRFQQDGEIDHSTNLALVRPDGALDVRVDGLGRPKDELARRIFELAR